MAQTYSLGKCNSVFLELFPNQTLPEAQHALQSSLSGLKAYSGASAVARTGFVEDDDPPKLVVRSKGDDRVWEFGIESPNVV